MFPPVIRRRDWARFPINLSEAQIYPFVAAADNGVPAVRKFVHYRHGSARAIGASQRLKRAGLGGATLTNRSRQASVPCEETS